MPKIRIQERQDAPRAQAGAISNTVYIPIIVNEMKVAGATDKTHLPAVGLTTRTVFASADAFKAIADRVPSSSNATDGLYPVINASDDGANNTAPYVDPTSLDYKLCIHLLNIGFTVAVDFIDSVDNISKDAIVDKGNFDIRFLTAGGTATNHTSTVNDELTLAAKTRGDCVALLCTDETVADFDYSVSSVRGKFNSTNGEYAAAFTPWFITNHGDFGENVKIPACYGYLFAYANAIKNNPEWYAIAGQLRGVIPELADVCHAYSSAEVEILQARSSDAEVDLDHADDNNDFAINPICNVRPAGYIIYGNRTLIQNIAGYTLTAQSFLNIRNGVSAIKKVMYDASRKYTFEPNTETLWINFQAYITPLLNKMMTGNGLLGYRFIRQTTDAKARLKARLNIIPVEAVEDFDLEIYMTDDLTVVG